jgi:putative FmdB family regulatory protein
MPIYEYRCRACGEHFEKIVMSASARPACPACDSRKLDRVPTAFGIGGGGDSAAHAGGGGGCSGCKRGSCSTCH